MGGGGWVVVVGGGMRPNTATSRSFAFAFASTTLSIGSLDIFNSLRVELQGEKSIGLTPRIILHLACLHHI